MLVFLSPHIRHSVLLLLLPTYPLHSDIESPPILVVIIPSLPVSLFIGFMCAKYGSIYVKHFFKIRFHVYQASLRLSKHSKNFWSSWLHFLVGITGVYQTQGKCVYQAHYFHFELCLGCREENLQRWLMKCDLDHWISTFIWSTHDCSDYSINRYCEVL